MKRILHIIGDLRLAFFLILACAAVMWIGSIYASAEYELFNSMNGVRIQDWFFTTGMENIGMTWWVPLLFIVFSLLVLNILACTFIRILALLPVRKKTKTKRFLVLLSPSIVHLIFVLMLAGHFAGFVLVKHSRVEIAAGEEVFLDPLGRVKIVSIEHKFFPDLSLVKDRVKQSEVKLLVPDYYGDREVVVKFLEPLFVNGALVQLDMKKIKKDQMVVPLGDETCNREKDYHYKENNSSVIPQLYLISTYDPGLWVLLPGFALIILVMGWYFFQVVSIRGSKKISGLDD